MLACALLTVKLGKLAMAPPYTEGIMPAIITPMNADGSVNYDAFRAVLEDNIQRGVHGFWIAGGTGESVYLTEEENMALADISVEVCKGRATTIHHVGVSAPRSCFCPSPWRSTGATR